MTQGERVKELRTSLGLSMDKFSEKLGVTKAAISKIENGSRNLTEQMAVAICKQYNVNYDWLVNDEGDMMSDLPETILDELVLQYDLDEMERSMIAEYVKLSESERSVLKKYITNVFKSCEK